jgi:hypothetical protein
LRQHKETLLAIFTFFSEFLPLIFCLIFLKKALNKKLKVFFYYSLGLSIFSAATLFIAAAFKNKEIYYYVIRVFGLFEILVIPLYFNRLISLKKFPLFIGIGAGLYCLLTFFEIRNHASLPKIPLIFEFFFLIVIIVFFLFRRMQDVLTIPLSSTISFWISVGLFIYYTGNFFYVLLTLQSVSKEVEDQMKLIYSVVTFAKNILISMALFGNEIEDNNENLIEIPDNINLDTFDVNQN